ncbi:MAG: hypothetical protein GY849_09775, partial [Deltaproteobacteria bacterium]|nr:hypothetical protein [Deltaproteobacteria bacterium]
MHEHLKKTLARIARFYDQRKVGDVGPLGFRRSTDLKRLLACLDRLLDEGIVKPRETLFLDLGCADGRVNILLSYLVRISAGIELDAWTFEEYGPLRAEVEGALKAEGLLALPENTFLFQGDSTDEAVHEAIRSETGVPFREFDLFYTYLVMHEEFAGLIAEKGKKGAIFMVYGFQKILPRYKGFRLLDHISPMEGILAL